MSKRFIVTESEKNQIRKMYLTEDKYYKGWTDTQLSKLENKLIDVYEVRPNNPEVSKKITPYQITSVKYIENSQFLLSCKLFNEGEGHAKLFNKKEFIYTCHKFLQESEGKTVTDEATFYSATFSNGNVTLDDDVIYENLTEYLKGICEYNGK